MIAAVMFLGGCNDNQPTKATTQSTGLKTVKPTQVFSVAGRKVLLVHSYHAGYSWVDNITQGVKDILEDTGVRLEVFYMDTKRHPDAAFMVHAGELATRKVKQYGPDVVITADDAAQEYFAKKYIGDSLPFVFCGVNADPSKYGYPAKNVTGIIERCQYLAALEYFRKFHPVRKIAVLSCDDYTSRVGLNYIKQHKADVEVLEYKLTNDFKEWNDRIRRYSTSVDAIMIYNYHTLKEHPGDTVSMEPRRVMAWTTENSTVPIFGVANFAVIDGALAGVVEWPMEHGESAAGYALKILRGTFPGDLPIVPAQHGQKMINRHMAAKFGVRLTPDLTRDALIVP
jgi:ABC-type uncharacterized transport system substrate-binding protein